MRSLNTIITNVQEADLLAIKVQWQLKVAAAGLPGGWT